MQGLVNAYFSGGLLTVLIWSKFKLTLLITESF